jgi:hypothetical protein
MRWFSRRFRNPEAPQVAIIVAADNQESFHDIRQAAALRDLFATFELQRVPVTWAIVDGRSRWPLGEDLLASQLPHELAFNASRAPLAEMVPKFQQLAMLAKRVQLPLRTLLSHSAGVHPTLLRQLGVQVYVPTAFGPMSPTGHLRAIAWNVWEAPLTDTVDNAGPAAELLPGRLDAVVRQSTRMHLLLRLTEPPKESFGPSLRRFLDRARDYHARGWIRLTTAGQMAASVAFDSKRRAA